MEVKEIGGYMEQKFRLYTYVFTIQKAEANEINFTSFLVPSAQCPALVPLEASLPHPQAGCPLTYAFGKTPKQNKDFRDYHSKDNRS